MESADRLGQLLERKQALQLMAAASPELGRRLQELRTWQAARLAATYATLRTDPRYAAAVEFFLSDLYASHNFAQRDRDLARAASPLRRALPRSLLEILCTALELEVLTTELDHAMASQLHAAPTEASYAAAYRAVGRSADRERQIDLICRIGAALDAVVRNRWVGFALRAARTPAHLAGLTVLQDFLERGWAAFLSLPAANPLFEEIRRRETALMHALLEGAPDPFAATAAASTPTAASLP